MDWRSVLTELKDIYGRIAQLFENQAVFLSFSFKKKTNKMSGQPMKVVALVSGNRIVVSPRDRPGRRMMIDPDTRVSLLDSGYAHPIRFDS